MGFLIAINKEILSGIYMVFPGSYSVRLEILGIHKHIIFPFPPNRRFRTMSGYHKCVFFKGVQSLANRSTNSSAISTPQVCSTDSASKQGVSGRAKIPRSQRKSTQTPECAPEYVSRFRYMDRLLPPTHHQSSGLGEEQVQKEC